MMAGLSIFYTYEPVCFSPPSSAHLSLSLATLILFHRLGSRPWQRIMQLHSVRVVLGREEGRKRGWVSSLQSVRGLDRRKRYHRHNSGQEASLERKGRERS